MTRLPITYRPYLAWRHRLVEQRLREQWQEAVRLARQPIIHTATDENCPTHVVVAHGYGVPGMDGGPQG
jgi:hypothetical protein